MEPIGALIESGPSDWQIVQQDARGLANISLAGRWRCETPGTVEMRLVHEDTGVPVCRALDWQPAEMAPDGTWHGILANVPAGGLYRLETRLHEVTQVAGEWSMRGDMRHFLGVGDLWVIAGQSNSAGFGRGPYQDPVELGVHVFRNSEQWALAAHPLNESTGTQHPANREYPNPGHSPYLHFARLLKQHLGYPIGLVQTALGGSPLSAWNPTEPGDAPLFANMLHCVACAGGKVKGILWYQGESDANRTLGPTYGARFASAVAAWREALAAPSLPVLTVQLNRHQIAPTEETEQGWSLVREAQRQAAQRIAGVTIVPALDLPLSDPIHTSPAGNMLLAERLARCALGAVYGRPVEYAAPDLQTARASANGHAIVLTFAPVTSRMDNVDQTAIPFGVEDSAGIVPIAGVTYPGDATVRLALGRALTGKAVVHGGYGLSPASVPMDAERFMPMLGFLGVPVEN